jgi:hypothetical protein
MYLQNVAQERAKPKDPIPQRIHYPHPKIPRYIAKAGAQDKKEFMPTSPEKITHKTTRNMDLTNWDFLRAKPKDAMEASHQKEFQRLLNTCRDAQDVDSSFVLEKPLAATFLNRYYAIRKFRKEFTLPSEVHVTLPKILYYQILLRILDRVIHLEEHTAFSSNIMGDMKKIIESNLDQARRKPTN